MLLARDTEKKDSEALSKASTSLGRAITSCFSYLSFDEVAFGTALLPSTYSQALNFRAHMDRVKVAFQRHSSNKNHKLAGNDHHSLLELGGQDVVLQKLKLPASDEFVPYRTVLLQ